MAQRSNHYEAAFEAYLRELGQPYVAVDEQRRTMLGESSLKSVDFIVRPYGGRTLLIDVKGRKSRAAGRRCENWVTLDDITSLLTWQEVFGGSAEGILLFAYQIIGEISANADSGELFAFRGEQYSFHGVTVADYQAAMRLRSPKWETYWVKSAQFARIRQAMPHLLQASAPTLA